jgi:hypothetical protein
LFYWNGLSSTGTPATSMNDINFGAAPLPSYSLTLFDISNVAHSADGTNTVVPGGVIDTTATDGFIHRHLFWFLQDNDGNSGTTPADGLYMVAIRMKMPNLRSSLPVLLIFGTPNSSVDAEDNVAFPWAEQQTSLPGDYNGDGAVDAADYTVWRATLNESASSGLLADGSGNGVVDRADYDVWKSHFGQSAQITFGASVGAGSIAGGPVGVAEPASFVMFVFAGTVFVVAVGAKRRRTRIGALHSVSEGYSHE